MNYLECSFSDAGIKKFFIDGLAMAVLLPSLLHAAASPSNTREAAGVLEAPRYILLPGHLNDNFLKKINVEIHNALKKHFYILRIRSIV